MPIFKRASTLFALTLLFWATVSLAILSFMMTVVAKLDFSFLEANGMLRVDFMREALTQQLFLAVDPTFYWMLAGGLLAVVVIAYIFAQTQCNYIRNMAEAFSRFTERLEMPPLVGLGPLTAGTTRFFEVIDLRLKVKADDTNNQRTNGILGEWVNAARLSHADIAPFIVLSIVLSVLFAIFCVIFFLQVSNRIVELGLSVVKFTNPSGPTFLAEQYKLVSLLIWTISLATGLAFVIQGYRFGRRLADCNYALLRDLKKFMSGDLSQRLFLRTTDPGFEHIAEINHTLDELQKKLS